jgi:hypothetical protein
MNITHTQKKKETKKAKYEPLKNKETLWHQLVSVNRGVVILLEGFKCDV